MAAAEDWDWMQLPQSDLAWIKGCLEFIEKAFPGNYEAETVRCPCTKCGVMAWKRKEEVIQHLITNGFGERFIREKQSCHHPCARPMEMQRKVLGSLCVLLISGVAFMWFR